MAEMPPWALATLKKKPDMINSIIGNFLVRGFSDSLFSITMRLV